jgi:hypothetical protein
MVVTTYSYGGPPANLGTGHVSLVGAQLFTPARDRQGEVAIVLWLGAKLEQSHSDVALVVAGKVFRGDWSGTLVDAVGLGGAASGHDEKQLAFKAEETGGAKARWQPSQAAVRSLKYAGLAR